MVRLGTKTKNALRIGTKVAVGVGALAGLGLGVKHEGDKYVGREQEKQKEELGSTFSGIAKGMGERGVPRTDPEGQSIVKRTSPVVTGGGRVAPPAPPPPSRAALATRAVGVMVGGASLKDELISAGQDYHQRSLTREQQEKQFRQAQQRTAQQEATTAQGGMGGTDASVRELSRIGGRKLKKALTPSMPKLPFRHA